MKSTYLSHLGIINSLGAGTTEVSNRLLRDCESFLEPYPNLFSGRDTWVGRVNTDLPKIPEHLKNYDCRNNQLLLGALQQVETEIRAVIQKVGPSRVAVVLGTSTSGMSDRERFIRGELKEMSYQQQEIGNCSQFLAEYLNLSGISYTISTACSSSAKVFISAQRLIDADLCDAAIVGGSDSLCELTLNGFDCLESVSDKVCNPFSRNRRGINIGEGAAVFLMSRDKSPIKFFGGSESSDGYHISAPDPTGRGAEIAIRGALNQANLTMQDIGYVNLHGTATVKNDSMESAIMHSIFGSETMMSSTKPMVGHTLGAAGAIELAFCYLSLLNPEKRLPKHLWDNEQDPLLPKLRLVTDIDRWERPIFMSNSFAFGGNNASLIIGLE